MGPAPTFATLLLENDVDIKSIQSLSSHGSIMTTQIYTRSTSKNKKNPRDPPQDEFIDGHTISSLKDN